MENNVLNGLCLYKIKNHEFKNVLSIHPIHLVQKLILGLGSLFIQSIDVILISSAVQVHTYSQLFKLHRLISGPTLSLML